MMRHLLINGFSKSLVARADEKAVGRLRRVVPLLREVTYVHLCNSSEVQIDILSRIGSIHKLTLAQMSYDGLDDVLAFVYSLPLLKSLSIKALTVGRPAVKAYTKPPGPASTNFSSFEIGEMKASSPTCSRFTDWLTALDPVPSIRTMSLQARDEKYAPFRQHQLRRIGSSIRSIHLNMGTIHDGMERSLFLSCSSSLQF